MDAQKMTPETIRLQPTRGFGRVLAPRELWRYRDLALQIAARDITVRYRQAALGAAWAVLQPLGLMVVFTVFFNRLGGLESTTGVPYALFTLAALVPWTFYSTVVTLGADSLVTNTELIAKVYFPRIFIPLGVMAAGLIDFAVSLVILLAVVLIYGTVPTVAILMVPVLVAIMLAAGLGVVAGLSAANVRYRDIRYVVPFTVQLWLFVTPIAYSSEIIGEPWRMLSAINPMVGVVEGFRWATLGSEMSAPWALMGVSAVSAAVLLVAGLIYFDRVERSFADLI